MPGPSSDFSDVLSTLVNFRDPFKLPFMDAFYEKEVAGAINMLKSSGFPMPEFEAEGASAIAMSKCNFT